jgi:hypothetical protein
LNNLELKKTICRILACKDKAGLASLLGMITPEYWDYVYDFLFSYNLCPLFYSIVKQNDLNVPSEIVNKLQQKYIASSSQYIKRPHELKHILSEFNKEDIDVIPLKGAYLSEKYYKNPVSRPMCDIDLLVKRDDVRKTLYTLDQFGFKSSTKYNYDFYINNRRHIPPFFSKNNTSLEVHYTIFMDDGYNLKNVKIDLDNIWSTCAETTLYGQKSFAMSIENLILHLCIHIAGDKFQQKILHLFDIFQIIQTESINWQLLISKSKEWKVGKILYCILLSLNKLFNLKINSVVQKHLMPKEIMPEIEDWLEKRLLCDLSSQVYVKMNNFKVSSFKDKLKYLKYTIFSDYVICSIYGVSNKSFRKHLYYFPRLYFLLKRYLNIFMKIYVLKKRKNLQEYDDDFKPIEDWLTS